MKKLLGIGLFFGVLLGGCRIGHEQTTSAPRQPPPPAVDLGIVSSIAGITVLTQQIIAADQDSEVEPGRANYWDINCDFSLSDGWDDQFDGALDMQVTIGVNSSFYPCVNYSDLTFFTPQLDAADGVVTANITTDRIFSGTASAFLYSTHESILQQTVDLTSAMDPTTLTWSGDESRIARGAFGDTAFIRVQICDTSGNVLQTVYERVDNITTVGTWGTADISSQIGQTVILKFVQRHQGQGRRIDDVSIGDTVTEFVNNGDFETGDMTGWSANALTTVQNYTAAPMEIVAGSGLNVARSFFTVPNKKWGRWVDVLTNTTTADITANVVYITDLGSNNTGIIYPTPGVSKSALTTWDGFTSDRDVGFVHGNVDTRIFLSHVDFGNFGGSDILTWSYKISVPASGSVAIVNFIVMNGTDTGETALNLAALASDIDNELNRIVRGWGTDVQYQQGMTQAQIDAVGNF